MTLVAPKYFQILNYKTSQQAQRRFDTVENESCADVGFRRCDNVVTTFSNGFLGQFTTGYSDFIPFMET